MASIATGAAASIVNPGASGARIVSVRDQKFTSRLPLMALALLASPNWPV
jgi:hypothetical protein